MNTNRKLISIAAFSVSSIAVATAFAQTAAKKPKAATIYGQFAVYDYATDKVLYTTGKGFNVDLAGPKLRITSPQYDMTAPFMHMEVNKSGIPPRYKVTNAIATGGVRIVTHDDIDHRTTTLTCDKAVYRSTVDPKDKGRIDMTGHVHSETLDPSMLDGPLVQDSDSGYVAFIDATHTEILLNNGTITGTMIEPTPKPPKPKPTKKP